MATVPNTTPRPKAPRISPSAAQHAEILERIALAGRAIAEATQVNQESLSTMIGLARMLDSLTQRMGPDAAKMVPQAPARTIAQAIPATEAAAARALRIREEKEARREAPAPDPQPQPAPAPAPAAPAGNVGIPKSGRQLYAWSTDHGLLGSIKEIGQGRGFPGRIIDWTPNQVSTAYYDLFESEDEPDDAAVDAMAEDRDGPAY